MLVARGELEPDNPAHERLHEILRIDRPRRCSRRLQQCRESQTDWVRPIVHFEILARDPQLQRSVLRGAVQLADR